MTFCTLEDYVIFNDGTPLNYKRPFPTNTRSIDRDKQEYDPPNGRRKVIISAEPEVEIRDLTFEDCDFTPLLNFWQNNIGKLFTYTNHYGEEVQAVFLKGPTVIETHDNANYEVRISLRCFQ